jgi:hypothetical protein
MTHRLAVPGIFILESHTTLGNHPEFANKEGPFIATQTGTPKCNTVKIISFICHFVFSLILLLHSQVVGEHDNARSFHP